MKSLKIPMKVSDFELMEEKFGWKNEFHNGLAHILPREHGILMKIKVEKRRVETKSEIRSISDTTLEEICELFYEAFVDSVEYCDYKKSAIKKRAEIEINNFIDGKRGKTQLKLSRIAVLPSEKKKLVGACLVTKYKYGFKNEILFVRPKFQGKGLGTALVSTVLNELSAGGEKLFWSEYHICNQQSADWHKKFGFIEETDILTAKYRRNYFKNEIWRHEWLGNTQRAQELKPFMEKAEAEVKRLQKIEDKDFGAAWLSWKNDY